MSARKSNLYQVREFANDTAYSVQLGSKLRHRKTALKLVNRLQGQGREVFISPIMVRIRPKGLK